MRKLFTVVLLLSFSVAFAQTDKGWRSVGGTGHLALDFKDKAYTFDLSPEIYWFVANSFALGTDFGAGFYFLKVNDSIRSNSVYASVTPGFRYYFRDPEKKWRPYGFLNGGVLTMASKYGSAKSTTTGFRGYAGLGLAWFFSDHAAFDTRLHVIDIYSWYPHGSQVKFNPSFSIGIQAFFD